MSASYVSGKYQCEIIEQGLSASANGNQQIWLKIMPVSSDDPCCEILNYERTIWWTITEKTVEFICDKLSSLGFTGGSWKLLDPSNPNFHSFVGQTVECECKWEKYQGTDKEKWDLARVGGSTPEPLDMSGLNRLEALFGKKLKEKCGKPAAKPAPRNARPAPAARAQQAVADAGFDQPNGQEQDAGAIPF